MQITISGSKGEGKTTVAICIARLLIDCGCRVRLMGYNPSDTNFLKQMLKDTSFEDATSAIYIPQNVTVVDSLDLSCENDVVRITDSFLQRRGFQRLVSNTATRPKKS